MKRLSLGLVMLACFALTPLVRSDAAPTTRPSALAAILPYLGEWKITAAWSGGAPLEARAVYEWGLNKKYIVARTFVKNADGTEYQRYENIFADVDGKVTLYSFTFEGHSDVRTATIEGAKMRLAWKTDDGTSIQQYTEMTDSTHMAWHVEVAGADGQFKPVMDGVWVKVAK